MKHDIKVAWTKFTDSDVALQHQNQYTYKNRYLCHPVYQLFCPICLHISTDIHQMFFFLRATTIFHNTLIAPDTVQTTAPIRNKRLSNILFFILIFLVFFIISYSKKGRRTAGPSSLEFVEIENCNYYLRYSPSLS